MDSGNGWPDQPAPKVSVLVPVFNAQKFLRACMDTLVGQTLHDIEIICIDDGSTDASPAILAEYAARDERVRVITKENSGYGDSMNVGVRAARGDWLGICEPDDFVSKSMFSVLVEAGERYHCDLVKANYREHSEDSLWDPRIGILDAYGYGRPFDPHDMPSIVLIAPTIWSGIYRRELVVENGISFSPTPGASFQDTSFGQQCWIAAKRAFLIKRGLYHYRIDNDASSSKSGTKVFAVCGEFERTFRFLHARQDGSLQAFGRWLNVTRHGTYLWNYNRISAEHHLEFAERWLAEMEDADGRGMLDTSLMTEPFRKLLDELREGPEAFTKRYPDEIPVLPIR